MYSSSQKIAPSPLHEALQSALSSYSHCSKLSSWQLVWQSMLACA
jgi:hypothetical protein